MRTRRFAAVALTAATLGTTAGLTGCASMNRTGKGAVIGAGAGGAVGAIIGKQVGSTAKGAILGAAVGGAAGAIIGHRMDEQAKNLAATIPGATVQRVGEGIVVTFDSGLLFPFNSTQLLPAGQQNLQNLAQSLEQYPETQVLIVGHTDSIGSAQYNQTLSEQRAESAANVLSSYGVPRDRIQTSGRGETEPIADNSTAAGQAQNRRVEVAIYASEEYRDRLLKNNPGQ
ncbi:MAG TPA: OmpA family protein [Longimicrobiaceae bacterium]|nr:OmpA family protein [Longimicrobiaceae bacterium]